MAHGRFKVCFGILQCGNGLGGENAIWRNVRTQQGTVNVTPNFRTDARVSPTRRRRGVIQEGNFLVHLFPTWPLPCESGLFN